MREGQAMHPSLATTERRNTSLQCCLRPDVSPTVTHAPWLSLSNQCPMCEQVRRCLDSALRLGHIEATMELLWICRHSKLSCPSVRPIVSWQAWCRDTACLILGALRQLSY